MVGLGNMGGRMARRLVSAGYDVRGFDADPARAQAAGVTPAASLAELAAGCDVILLSLPDSTVIEAVMRGDGGLLASVSDGQIIVDLSTADPQSTRAIHDDLAPRGVRYLDAGISGGAAAADQGTLTLMVGGDGEALTEVAPILDTFSAHVHHMGASGAGHVTKVLNNFLNGVTLAATAEVMVAGKKAGLDLAQLLEVINTSSGVSFASLNRFPKIIQGDYLEGGLTGQADGQGRPAVPDAGREPRRRHPGRPGHADGLPGLQRPRLRRPDQQPGGGRLRGPGRRCPRRQQARPRGRLNMHVAHGRAAGQPSEQRTATFTGTVHLDPVLAADGVMVNNVVFTPGARTYWHRHPGGQLLVVTAGRGHRRVSRSGQVHVLEAGDVVWTEPGEEHWHGGCRDSLLVHTAVSHGTTQWHDAVGDADYDAAHQP